MKDKVVLITGSASGLGAAMAHDVLGQGGIVVGFDRVEQIPPADAPASDFHSHIVDVTDEDAVVTAVAKVIDQHGRIDVLVNSAGILHSAPLLNLMNRDQMRHDYAEFQRVININLGSVFLMSSVVAEAMIRKRTKGLIVNISSISARGNAGQSAYAAAKSGVEALAKVWAKELAPFGIRANAIAPGFIDTPSTHTALSEKHLEIIKSEIPLGRLGEAHHIAKALAYLVQNDFVNGTVLRVDGGMNV